MSATDHRKKKRLQGPGCVSVRELLQDLAEVQLERFPTVHNSGAVLCSECEKELKRIEKIEKELACMKSNVKKKLSALPQKRPCSGDVSVAEKHGRMEDSSSVDVAGAATDNSSDECDGDIRTEASVSSQSPNVEVIIIVVGSLLFQSSLVFCFRF